MFAGCNTQLHQKAPPELHPSVAVPCPQVPLASSRLWSVCGLWAALQLRMLPHEQLPLCCPTATLGDPGM